MLKSGVRIIGGCCGTTPAHTRAMLGAVRMMSGGQVEATQIASAGGTSAASREHRGDGVAGVAGVAGVDRKAEAIDPMATRSRLGQRLAAGEFVVSVELDAPQGTDPEPVVQRVNALLDAGVDVVNVADGPRATARMSNLALCATLLARTGVEPILHVCARDRNYLGLVSHLMGAHALGMRNLVIITGDPPKMGDYPLATPVYDVDSIGLLRLAATLNSGFDPAGKALKGHTSFLLATGAEPAAQDREREIRRAEEKRAAGAELIMTQPVYDPRTLERFLDDVEPLGVPVMVGLLPLASHRNAEFLHNEVPGMRIPQKYRERMARVGSGPEARAEGVRIAQEALEAVKHRVAGAYIMPPFNRVDSAIAILDVVKDRWKPAPRPPNPP
jgi:homocysteine S-methyltransferase